MTRTRLPQFKTLRLALGSRQHPIYVGYEIFNNLGQWLKDFTSQRAFIVADEKLLDVRTKLVTSLKEAGWETHEILVRAGEGLKDFHTFYPLYGELLKRKANRDSVIFAVGGGSVGDAVGFLAATYLRGLPWVGVPTTLLAQVDSSVGGKTGINHAAGKNLIGCFYQPSLVICDLQALSSLSSREIISGLGEVIKYGMVFDPKFFQYLQKNMQQLLKLKPQYLLQSIYKSLQWKVKVVSKDELDQKGTREVLNFGHTFAHALESVTQYHSFQHGEAVIWGMRFALALSEVRQHMLYKTRKGLDEFLASLDVKPLPKEINFQDYIQVMQQDKKIKDGKIRFVLLKELGHTVSDPEVTEENLHKAFQLLNKV